ncbi:MAG TPA: hypothetical protein VFH27_09085 [Longimicrobiaceae bacterium]|nr:hypothetical protein [Longimicrobiaceae bacterium]
MKAFRQNGPPTAPLDALLHAGLRVRLFLIALCAFACTEANATADVVFYDDFNAENGMASRANYTTLAQWEIVRGTVDLAGSYPFELLPPGHGMYVDLDGASNAASTLRTRRALVLQPGDYEFSFLLAGSQRVSAPNVVHASVGTLFTATVTRPAFAEAIRYRYRIHVRRSTSVHIQFANDGGDNFGALLDDVVLRRTKP